jgi:hypothetical protein
MRENLKVVCAEFSALSRAVFVLSAIARYRRRRPHLKLKNLLKFVYVIIPIEALHYIR